MKMRYVIPMTIIAGLMGAVPAAHVQAASDNTTVEDVKHETRDMVEKLQAFGAEQRDEAIDEIDDGLSYLDGRIDALQARIEDEWDDMSDAARENARDTLDALKEQRVEVATWFERLKDSTADTWDDARDGVSDAYQELADGWSDAEKQLSESM